MDLATSFALALAGAALCGCAHTVEIRPTKLCEGGNIDDCRNRCKEHEGVACYKLGWLHEQGLHEQGQDVDHDFPRAKQLYEDACENKWAVACRALGDLYWKGEKVDVNRAKAIEYWQRACFLGLAVACPSQLELDVASGKLIVHLKDNGQLSVAPTPGYKPNVNAPNVSGPNAPAGPAVNTPAVNTPQVNTPTVNAPTTPQPTVPTPTIP